MSQSGNQAPYVVAIGGGHGLAMTLQAASVYAGNLTGVVSVADDGGSSGRLRAATGLPAMGDLRRCLTTLAAANGDVTAAAWARVFEHRFDDGELAGHAVGNLVITALAEELGHFDAAIDAARALLGVRAGVVPATEASVDLVAETEDGHVRGQVAVQSSARIKRVEIDPPDAPASRAALEAVAAADQIVLGPGSLYTSILAAAVVPGLREVVAVSAGPVVYVCNLCAQVPETDGYDVAAHVEALREHGLRVDVVVCDPAAPVDSSRTIDGVEVARHPVAIDAAHGAARGHDPALLAGVLASLV